MQSVTHIGANCTDGEKLIRSLMKNADRLAPRGIAVPGPGKYRALLRETLQSLAGGTLGPDARDTVLDAILDEQDTTRLVMSNAAFICQPNRIFERGVFYQLVRLKLRTLQTLFPQDELEIFLALRNPATFIPAVWAQAAGTPMGGVSAEDFMNGLAPESVLWSDVVERIQEAVPDAALTVWCNEDTPLIWGELMRRMAGVPPLTPLAGEHDLLGSIMSAEGMARFQKYIESHPPQSDAQARRIMAAFLDKYAIPDALEEEVDMPGWDDYLVEDLTRQYEADVLGIAQMPGVTFVLP